MKNTLKILFTFFILPIVFMVIGAGMTQQPTPTPCQTCPANSVMVCALKDASIPADATLTDYSARCWHWRKGNQTWVNCEPLPQK